MKPIYLIILIIFIQVNTISQSLDKKIPGTEKARINDLYGDLKITANNSESIKIEITGYSSIPESVKDLEAGQYKYDNTQLGLHFETMDKVLVISAANKQAQFANYRISLPKNAMIEIRNKFPSKSNGLSFNRNDERFNEFLNNITIKGLKNEIDINVFASDIKINNVTGPLLISAFFGGFDIDFLKLNQDNPTLLELFNGDIKVNLPYDTKCNIMLNSESGYIQTDFTIKKATVVSKNSRIDKNRIHGIIFKKYHETTIEGIINKRGTQLDVTTYNGNIKLYRKDYPNLPIHLYTD